MATSEFVQLIKITGTTVLQPTADNNGPWTPTFFDPSGNPEHPDERDDPRYAPGIWFWTGFNDFVSGGRVKGTTVPNTYQYAYDEGWDHAQWTQLMTANTTM